MSYSYGIVFDCDSIYRVACLIHCGTLQGFIWSRVHKIFTIVFSINSSCKVTCAILLQKQWKEISRTWRFSSHQKTTISYSLLTRYIDVYHCESDLSLSKWKTTKNKNYISNLLLMNVRAHMLENSFLHTLDKGIKLSNDLLYQSLWWYMLEIYQFGDWNISVFYLKWKIYILCSLIFLIVDFLDLVRKKNWKKMTEVCLIAKTAKSLSSFVRCSERIFKCSL